MTKKIQENFDEIFSSLLGKNAIYSKKIAIAVSGGADSLALVFLMQDWALRHDSQILTITVEHGLREDSLSEAQYVADLMKKNGIEHHILSWVGEKPQNNIEDEARIARYKLLADFCKENQITCLATGHHKLDQVETFLIRLQRGSGLDGLCGMSEVSNIYDLSLIRPILGFYPEELKQYLKNKNIIWKEDYLNNDDSFLRVRIRKAIPYLVELGFSIDRIYNTTKVLEKSKNFIENMVEKFIKDNVMFIEDMVAKIDYKNFSKQDDEIVFRVFSRLLKKIGKKRYIPRAVDVARICDLLKSENKLACTLGDCEILYFDSQIWIISELKENKIITKKQMEEFFAKNPAYNKIKMPYKAKRVLFYQ